MTTWIFGIDEHNPTHWDFALRHGYWDRTRRSDVNRGDLIFFWQAGASLLGVVRASDAMREIPEGTWMPWNLGDDKRASYRFRVPFDVLAEDSVEQPTWTEVKERAAVTGHLGFGPRQVPGGDGERWLWAQVLGLDTVPEQGEDSLYEQVTTLGDLSEDTRRRARRLVAQRQGQGRFRQQLEEAYGQCCAVTGPQPGAVLEAAHIQPYRNDQANALENGLLLRIDLHRLLDAHLMTLDEDGDDVVVRLSPQLRVTSYADLEGRRLRRGAGNLRPHRESILEHQKACEAWFPRGSISDKR